MTVSPLVLTKLQVPAARPRVLSRAHLIDQLSLENGARLNLVCAPAGYGKTTMLTNWAQSLLRDHVAVAWYALDPDDNTPALFGSYLLASLIQALNPCPALVQIKQLLDSSANIELQQILPAVINALVLSGQNCAIILDDYHLIKTPAIHQAVAYLIENLPANLRIAIGSRSNPPFALARMRARGQLCEIRVANLRFTHSETAQFLNEIMRLRLSEQDITSLEKRTEGWAAGLQLAALSLTGHTDKDPLLTIEETISKPAGVHRYLVDYLMEEVVNRQPEEVQSFLLATAVLDRMCAPLCDAITSAVSLGSPDHGSQILDYLEQTNLFIIALDDQRHWYRYHHLFRDFLLAQFQKILPDQILLAHSAACEWFASNGNLREAAHHAFQTRDWNYAAAFVEQHSFTMIIYSEISTIYEWCSRFPEDVMQRHPMLCILQCWALVFRYQRNYRSRVEARLRDAEQAIAKIQDPLIARQHTEHAEVVRFYLCMIPDPQANPQAQLINAERMLANYTEEESARFSALLMMGYAHLALYDVEAASKALEEARRTALTGRLYFGVIESTFHLARLAHCQGDYQQAIEICLQGKLDVSRLLGRNTQVHPDQGIPAAGCLDIAQGCALLELGQLDAAEQSLLHGLELIGWGSNPFYLMTVYIALFRLREMQGQTSDAHKYLNQLDIAWPDISFCTQGLRVLHALQENPDNPSVRVQAEDWCGSLEFSPVDAATPPGMGPFGAAEMFYLTHVTWFQIQVILGYAQAIQPMLELYLDLVRNNELTDRVNQLSKILAIMAARQQGKTGRSLPEPLSERELEVLGLIADGATNQMIAEQLVISIGTVKSHINHILTKLDAQNRTEAVARARKLNLLEYGS